MAIILSLFLEVAISNITIDVALQSSQPQSSQCHPVGPPGADHTVAIGCVSHGILPPIYGDDYRENMENMENMGNMGNMGK